MSAKKGGLGNGLDALFDDNSTEIQVKKTLRMSEIEPNRAQPRKVFNDESIAALAESIREHGILQPLLVRSMGNSYQIVAGERRWRAARMLGLDEVPVIIRELSDGEAMQIALIENLQRENLNPIEEAMGYKDLMDKFDMRQEDIAKVVGRSRSAIANAVRLLNLPDEIQKMLQNGEIQAGHAKALSGIADKALMLELARRAADGLLTVRAIEKAAAKAEATAENDSVSNVKIDSYFTEMEISLKERLGRRVSVKHTKNDKGALVLEFYDKDDLSELARLLTKKNDD